MCYRKIGNMKNQIHLIISYILILFLITNFASCSKDDSLEQAVREFVKTEYKNSRIDNIVINEGDNNNVYVDVVIVIYSGKKSL